jgi:chromosome segregation ATPase
MERGEKGSQAKHLSKAEHFEKKSKEVEQLERTTAKLQKTKEKLEDEIKINQDMNLIINAGRDKAKQEMEEYQLQAQQAALKLTKLNKTIDSKEIKLDALERSINDVQLQKLSIDEPRHRDALFTIAMNFQPADKQMEFIGNRAKETDNLMQEYGRFYDMKKSSSEPSFDTMLENVRQANIEILHQAKLNDMEELTIE